MNTIIRTRHIGTSCPWRVVAPAQMTPIARTLEAARTRPHVRAMLAAEAANATQHEPITPAASEPVIFAGHTLDAPGFTSEKFERAILRAFCDELQVEDPDATDRYMVSHPDCGIGYLVTRERCTCKAGTVGTPCKHRAVLILHLDIREPQRQREWAKVYADRRGRKAVA